MKYTLKTQKDIPANWPICLVKKVSTVKIRPSNGIEKFKVDWQDSELVSNPELDLIIISNNSEYPCKKDIFAETYEQVNENEWRKKEVSRIIQVPKGEEVEVETLEGKEKNIFYPDYIAIGKRGELYANSKDFVDKNLEFVQ